MSTLDPDHRYVTPTDASPRWARLRDALLDITRLGEVDSDEALQRLMATSAEALGVARVSYWRLMPDGRSIRRESMHVRDSGRDTQCSTLTASEAPNYFAALERTLTLAAEDVRLDERVRELLDSYLEPLGIGAMLDVAVRNEGRLIGVICHEHIGQARPWTAEERMFAAAISALAAQQIEHGQRTRAEAERRQALLTDRLTGLPNRLSLLESLGRSLNAQPPELGALLLLDIDRFHRINHAFGAEVGDQVLLRIAQRLQALYPGRCLARLGNDQFAIVCARADGDAWRGAQAEAERIRQAIQAPLCLGDRRLDLSVSIGVLLDLTAYSSADAALRDAMIAVDTASRGPRGNLALFDAGIQERVARRMRVELDLRRGMREGEFVLHLQPIVRASDLALIGAEALLRWRHPERGLLAPDSFLDIAEEAGLLAAIHAGCVAMLLASLSRWRQRHGLLDFMLSLNLSASQLSDPTIADTLGGLCERAGVPTSLLNLEITENVLLEAGSGVEAGLDAACALGAKLSLDDFGTGHASLSHLIRLPLASVKLDRSFVQQLGERERAGEIVRGMMGMAHALGLSVVAEGVETELQLSMLREMGCDELQGYAFDRPLPLDEFEARWLAKAAT